MRKWIVAALLAVSVAGGAALVSAHQAEDDDDAKERAALQAAKITLGEAIAAAEKEVPGGKVVEAGVESEDGVTSYVIEIDKDGEQTVRVDMQTGQAVKIAEADDNDDDDDDDDDKAAADDDDDDAGEDDDD